MYKRQVYIRLVGPEFTHFELAHDGEGHYITAGGGTLLYDVTRALQQEGLQLDARGTCMAANMSQTVGGLLATNVHHNLMRSFADITRWVDVVLANGTIVRSHRGEELFMLTLGGGGQSGVIVRASLDVSPRGVYEKSRIANFWTLLLPLEPMQVIKSRGVVYVKRNIPYDPNIVGGFDWTTNSAESKQYMDIDGFLTDPVNVLKIDKGYGYRELCFFIPTSLRWRVGFGMLGKALTQPLKRWCYMPIGMLLVIGGNRMVFRSAVYLAGNGYMGRTGPAATDNFLAVQIPYLSFVPNMDECAANLYADVLEDYPGQVRPHPGKRAEIPLNSGIAPAVYALLDEYDPFGMFR